MIGQKFQRIYQSFAIIFNRVIADFVHKKNFVSFRNLQVQTNKQASKQTNKSEKNMFHRRPAIYTWCLPCFTLTCLIRIPLTILEFKSSRYNFPGKFLTAVSFSYFGSKFGYQGRG